MKIIPKQEKDVDNPNGRWIFQRDQKGSGYTLKTFDISKDGSVASVAHIIKLGDFLFLDVEPADVNSDEVALTPYPIIPAHAIARIWIDEHGARIHFLDNTWLEKQIKAGKLEIPYAAAPAGTVLTATTEQLRKFALQHAEDKEAFSLNFDMVKVE